MNEQYIPTTHDVLEAYATAVGTPEAYQRRVWAERWLAQVEAAAEKRGAIKALRDAADDLEPGDQHESPYIKAGRDVIRTLRQRADRIANQEDRHNAEAHPHHQGGHL